MKTIREYLTETGLSEQDIERAAEQAWDRGLVETMIADYENPETAARRAKRSGPGVERAAKIHQARKAWLADQS